MLLKPKRTSSDVEICNVGSEDQTNVKTIAQTLLNEMKLKKVKLKLTGGVDGGRGWKGDVKNMLLDTSKLRSLGWKPTMNSKEAITKTAKQLAAPPIARAEKRALLIELFSIT